MCPDPGYGVSSEVKPTKGTEYLLDSLRKIKGEVVRAERIALFLDVDGTLVPMATRPESATIPDSLRQLLIQLARRTDFLLGIVSGRPNVELRKMFPTDDVICAGNHGLEILGRGFDEAVPGSEQIKREMSAIVELLRKRLKGIQGSLVRDKGLTVAVHYRLVEDPNVEALKKIVQETVDESETLTITQGDLVLEIRPDVPSNKGTAVIRILERMFGIDWKDSCLAIYMGDDLLDEDVFRALENGNLTVLVDTEPRETAAGYFVRDPGETARFLAWLATTRRN